MSDPEKTWTGEERAQVEGMRRHQLRREDGQSLVLVVLGLPLLLAMIALVIDGANLFAQRRSVQNAADAAVLAAAAKLNTDNTACAGPDTDTTTCAYRVRTTAQDYSSRNGGQGSLHSCVDGSDTNCYLTPYKTENGRLQVRLKKPVSGFFTHVIGLSNVLSASATSVGGLSPASAAGLVAPIAVSLPNACTPSVVPSCYGVTTTFNFDSSGYSLLDLQQVSTSGPIVGGNVSTSIYCGWITDGYPATLPANAWYGAEGDNGYKNGIKNCWPDDGSTVMLVPVFDVKDATTDSYHVVGFSAFVIDPGGVRWTGNQGTGNHTLTGHFTTFVAGGVGGGGNNFGVFVVTLFE